MVKALGKEIKAFYFDDSEEYDDSSEMELNIEDFEDLVDTENYELSKFGVLLVPNSDRWISFASAFKKWQKKQTHQTLLVSARKEDINSIKQVLSQFAGVKIQ